MLQVKNRIDEMAAEIAQRKMGAEFGRLGKDKAGAEARQKGVATLKEVLGNFEKQLRRIGDSADLHQHKATLSSDSVFSVKLEKGAQQLDFDVHVQQLATVHQVQIMNVAALAGGNVKLAGGANPIALDTSGLDLTTAEGVRDLARRINADSALKDVVRADLRHVPGQPTPYLLLSATTSGTEATFDLQSSSGTDLGASNATVLAQGQNAVVRIGNAGAEESYASNDITLFTGVTLSLKKANAAGETTRVSVTPDMEGTAANMRALVQAYDAVRKQLRELMDPGTPGASISPDSEEKSDVKPAGAFYADAGVRALLRDLERNFERPVTIDGKTFDPTQFGVKRNADGSVTFDQKRFEAAYAGDKALLAQWFGETADVMKRDTSTDLDKQPAGMRLAVRIREWTDEITGVLKHRTDTDEVATQRLAAKEDQLRARFLALVARYTDELARAEQVQQQMKETRGFVDALFRGSRKSDD
ncbi:flagellar filament capping protein FliD [Pandoraea fibrosis]|uniref:Flagellar hook-associated protein 2 n=1 Tax=Pandoraea fibrosis TaxID=1891094 RepID=A0A5E4V0C8_9BURK|nr:flagellar filament capping protein FliD [Pandoraea fibrosis]QHE91274.1 flagellar filament capping protein FliD [Pandoraea fibrosis]QHF15169.1 flagellar filament capping protein FliD [Pandoraea fibrosis]VVE05742.1 flagellar capping protein [Pandoraea fibrosis]